jgi:hypothetical protein
VVRLDASASGVIHDNEHGTCFDPVPNLARLFIFGLLRVVHDRDTGPGQQSNKLIKVNAVRLTVAA